MYCVAFEIILGPMSIPDYTSFPSCGLRLKITTTSLLPSISVMETANWMLRLQLLGMLAYRASIDTSMTDYVWVSKHCLLAVYQ